MPVLENKPIGRRHKLVWTCAVPCRTHIGNDKKEERKEKTCGKEEEREKERERDLEGWWSTGGGRRGYRAATGPPCFSHFFLPLPLPFFCIFFLFSSFLSSSFRLPQILRWNHSDFSSVRYETSQSRRYEMFQTRRFEMIPRSLGPSVSTSATTETFSVV